jgi:hypothetical protein
MHPPAQQVYRDMLTLEHKISDYSKPLRWSKQVLIQDTENTFKGERDPITGAKWVKWSPTYAAYVRERGQKKILQRNWSSPPLRMYKAATSPRNWRIVPRLGIQFNFGKLPHYWVFHQQPDNDGQVGRYTPLNTKSRAFAVRRDYFLKKRIASSGQSTLTAMRRKYPTATSAQLKKLTAAELTKKATADAAYEFEEKSGIPVTKRGQDWVQIKKHYIPQRRFLGVSPVASSLLQRTFDDWANDVVTWVDRAGTISPRRFR